MRIRFNLAWLVTAIVAADVAVQAQTNTFPASGSVGIGMPASPYAILAVNGGTTVDTTGGGGNGLVWSLGSGHNGIMPALRSISGGSYSPGQVESSYFVINGETGGNVGIGTTQPQTTLHVSAPASNSLLWAGSLQNPGNDASAGVGVGLQFKASAYIYGNPTETNKWSGIAGVPDVGSTYEDHFGVAFYTHNGVAVAPAEVMRIASSGNVGIGTTTPAAPLEINGNIKLTAGSGASVTFPDGTVQATAWNGTTLGGDYAESVDVLGDRKTYEPGDLIVIDASSPGKFEKSSAAYSRLVAGVFSTKPGLVGRRVTAARPDKEAEVPMAMMGIVPTKVSTENGPIEPGDLLVTARTPGYAMKGTDNRRLTGAVIGKALAPLKAGSGVIEVLIALQ